VRERVRDGERVRERVNDAERVRERGKASQTEDVFQYEAFFGQ
jgi:hypothetical protein